MKTRAWNFCRKGMRCVVAVCLAVLSLNVWAVTPSRETEVLLLLGAPGEAEYSRRFESQVEIWQKACTKAGVTLSVIGRDERAAADLQQALKKAATSTTGQFWLVMIGHGTHDGRDARFSLKGPDVTPKQLADWLRPLRRELVFIHTGSASAAFLSALTGKNRVLISATKSADEIYYTRFGEYFAPAIAGQPEADLDQDRQVSLLEAFLYAGRRVAEFYEEEGRIATEHALLDDNGDGVAARVESFEGLRAKTSEKGAADGARAAQIALVLNADEARLSEAQRAKRDALERQLEVLKSSRENRKEEDYYRELEALLRELAALYAETTDAS